MLGRFSSPITTMLVVAVIMTTGYLIGEHVTGSLQAVLSGAEDSLGIQATATLFLLVAYLPAAHLFLCRWTTEHLTALRASFGAVITYEQSAQPSTIAGLLGAVIFLLLFIFIPVIMTGFPALSFQLVAALVVGASFGWLAGRFSVCMVRDALRMSELARSLPHLDLLDQEPISPFVQQGVRSALLTIIVPVLSLHLSVAPGDRVFGAAAYLFIWLTLTLVAFTLPVRGIHDRILVEKRSELKRIRDEIRDARDQVAERGSDGRGGRLSALLDFELRLERVPEWPYDPSSWRRLALYLLLGLGSWIGAALVERLLDMSF